MREALTKTGNGTEDRSSACLVVIRAIRSKFENAVMKDLTDERLHQTSHLTTAWMLITNTISCIKNSTNLNE